MNLVGIWNTNFSGNRMTNSKLHVPPSAVMFFALAQYIIPSLWKFSITYCYQKWFFILCWGVFFYTKRPYPLKDSFNILEQKITRKLDHKRWFDGITGTSSKSGPLIYSDNAFWLKLKLLITLVSSLLGRNESMCGHKLTCKTAVRLTCKIRTIPLNTGLSLRRKRKKISSTSVSENSLLGLNAEEKQDMTN